MNPKQTQFLSEEVRKNLVNICHWINEKYPDVHLRIQEDDDNQLLSDIRAWFFNKLDITFSDITILEGILYTYLEAINIQQKDGFGERRTFLERHFQVEEFDQNTFIEFMGRVLESHGYIMSPTSNINAMWLTNLGMAYHYTLGVWYSLNEIQLGNGCIPSKNSATGSRKQCSTLFSFLDEKQFPSNPCETGYIDNSTWNN